MVMVPFAVETGFARPEGVNAESCFDDILLVFIIQDVGKRKADIPFVADFKRNIRSIKI